MILSSAALFRYRLPFCEPLTLGGATRAARTGWLLRLGSEAGAEGWGEAAPLPRFSRESTEAAGAALCEAVPGLLGADASDVRDDVLAIPPSARFAVGQACAALRASGAGACASDRGPVVRPTVELNGLLLGSGAAVVAHARALHADGFRTLKLKVGRASVAEDAALVRRVADAVPGVRLRLDANRAWSWEEGLQFAAGLEGLTIDYLEEPLREPARLAAFHAVTGLPVALDETVCTLAPEDLAHHAYARAVVLKPTLLGWETTRAWMRAAARHGIAAPLSSAFESGVGLRGLVALAAAGDGAPAGFDTYRRLAGDVLAPRLTLGATVDVAAVLDGARRVRTEDLERIEHWTL